MTTTTEDTTINELWTCETHPGRLWSGQHKGSELSCEPGCAGPGMPLRASLSLLNDLVPEATAKDVLPELYDRPKHEPVRELHRLLLAIAQNNSPEDAQLSAQMWAERTLGTWDEFKIRPRDL